MNPYNLQLKEELLLGLQECSPSDGEISINVDSQLTITHKGFYLNAEDLASFFIPTQGPIHTKIYIQNSTFEDYLNSLVSGLVLMQKKHLLLHGNSFISNHQHIALCGHSEAGKSSLAAQFHHDGALFFCDEIICLNKQQHALPGYPYLRLWENDISFNSFCPHLVTQLWQDENKFRLDTSEQRFCETRKLDILIYLEIDEACDSPQIEQLKGAQKLETFYLSFYRPHIVDAIGLLDAWKLKSLEFIQGITIFKVKYSKQLDSRSSLYELISKSLFS